MAASINRCGNTLFMDFQCRNLEYLNLVRFLKVKYAIFCQRYDLFVKKRTLPVIVQLYNVG